MTFTKSDRQLAAIFAVCLHLFSATAPAQPATPSSSFAFEVAAVRPDNSRSTGSTMRFEASGRFVATNITVQTILQSEAFDLPASRILGGPKWLNSTWFDIEAKPDAATFNRLRTMDRVAGQAAIQAMFQNLLADRFQFKAHWEQRDLPAYALGVAKGGPKLQPAAHPERSGGNSSGNGSLQAVNLTLPAIADLFTQGAAEDLGRVVIDRTGLQGSYDFRIRWTREGAPIPLINGAPDPDPPPSIFTAVQEQLGLKLEPTRAPVKVLMIDNLEMPSEN